jgi:hypothetical protein
VPAVTISAVLSSAGADALGLYVALVSITHFEQGVWKWPTRTEAELCALTGFGKDALKTRLYALQTNGPTDGVAWVDKYATYNTNPINGLPSQTGHAYVLNGLWEPNAKSPTKIESLPVVSVSTDTESAAKVSVYTDASKTKTKPSRKTLANFPEGGLSDPPSREITPTPQGKQATISTTSNRYIDRKEIDLTAFISFPKPTMPKLNREQDPKGWHAFLAEQENYSWELKAYQDIFRTATDMDFDWLTATNDERINFAAQFAWEQMGQVANFCGVSITEMPTREEYNEATLAIAQRGRERMDKFRQQFSGFVKQATANDAKQPAQNEQQRELNATL